MKFKVGQKWISRNHEVVTIVRIYTNGRDFPVHGVFANSKEVQEFTIDGRFSTESEDLPGDLIELIKSPQEYKTQNRYELNDYFDFLEYQFLVDGNISIPPDIKNRVATLKQAMELLLDIENNGYDEIET